MPVAKSFKDFEFLSEPYTNKGKEYIKVRNPKTKTIREVRWYSDEEYNKLYPEDKVEIKVHEAYFEPQKNALGFEKGYITIFKGDISANEDWFSASAARYAKWWGWYFISTVEIPELPEGITAIQLPWESVGRENGYLKTDNEVKQAVDAFLYEESNSQYIGTVGERIEIEVTVVKCVPYEDRYGKKNIHVMEDAAGNQFTWTTNAKSWVAGTARKIRGTVKSHSLYKNIKQTVLTRCSEI